MGWSSDDGEFFWECREDFGPGFGDEDIVFDANAAKSFDVDTGFYGEDHAGGEGEFRCF